MNIEDLKSGDTVLLTFVGSGYREATQNSTIIAIFKKIHNEGIAVFQVISDNDRHIRTRFDPGQRLEMPLVNFKTMIGENSNSQYVKLEAL